MTKIGRQRYLNVLATFTQLRLAGGLIILEFEMKKHASFILTASSAIFLSMAASSAHAASGATPGVDKRQANQQVRIVNGVRSGAITGREYVNIKRSEFRIKRYERRAKSDGVVTPRERATLHRNLNRQSKKIYKRKHNNRTR